MHSYKKLDMASTEWLTTHYLAKSNDRIRNLSTLPVNVGDYVLDLCCGPGLYIPHLLDLTGPTGHVTGLDLDAESLDAAHKRLSSTPHVNWDLKHSRVKPNELDLEKYDVVLLFNSIGYFDNPLQIVADLAIRMKTGATIVIKDFDLESFFFSPRDAMHWSQLINAAKASEARDNPVSFRNFFGRYVHTMTRAYPFTSCSHSTWTQLMHHPFSGVQREYIWRNVECLLKQASRDCPSDSKKYFEDHFYPGKARFFDEPDAVFVEVEYISQLQI